jgi:hypothetical protein
MRRAIAPHKFPRKRFLSAVRTHQPRTRTLYWTGDSVRCSPCDGERQFLFPTQTVASAASGLHAASTIARANSSRVGSAPTRSRRNCVMPRSIRSRSLGVMVPSIISPLTTTRLIPRLANSVRRARIRRLALLESPAGIQDQRIDMFELRTGRFHHRRDISDSGQVCLSHQRAPPECTDGRCDIFSS